MIDRDRLIKAWKIFRDSNPYEICDGREFRAIKEPEYCMGQMIEDTITLLKEQEPIAPSVCGSKDDGLGCWWYMCGKCKMPIAPKERFCRRCGQAVKWDGID